MEAQQNEPDYEIWGGRIEADGFEAAPAAFLEDCFGIEDARKTLGEWQSDPNMFAFIRDKNTGELVHNRTDTVVVRGGF